MRRAFSFCGVTLAVVACSLGCGDSGPPRIEGNVTLNGAPVKQGEIKFVPTDGVGAVASAIISDGAYSMVATLGPRRVEIQAFEQTGVQPLDASMPGSATVPVMKPLLPEKYNTASELTLTVEGDMDHDFELTLP